MLQLYILISDFILKLQISDVISAEATLWVWMSLPQVFWTNVASTLLSQALVFLELLVFLLPDFLSLDIATSITMIWALLSAAGKPLQIHNRKHPLSPNDSLG